MYTFLYIKSYFVLLEDQGLPEEDFCELKKKKKKKKKKVTFKAWVFPPYSLARAAPMVAVENLINEMV